MLRYTFATSARRTLPAAALLVRSRLVVAPAGCFCVASSSSSAACSSSGALFAPSRVLRCSASSSSTTKEPNTAQKTSSSSTSSSPPSLELPTYFQALTEKEMHEVDRIVGAFNQYFDHIRFRKGWEEPKFTKDEIHPLFEEAAEIVWRIRHALDARQRATGGGDPVLRQLGGQSQAFLHSDDVKQLLPPSQHHDAFVSALVHATMRDAVGYVEKLTKEEVEIFVVALHEHRYDPAAHAKSVVHEIVERHSRIMMRRAEMAESEKFVTEGSAEDDKWKEAIKKLYEANAALSDLAHHQEAGGPKK